MKRRNETLGVPCKSSPNQFSCYFPSIATALVAAQMPCKIEIRLAQFNISILSAKLGHFSKSGNGSNDFLYFYHIFQTVYEL